MKTVEHQTKEMEAIGYALRTIFGNNPEISILLNRYDKMVVEVKETWQNCFDEAANAKCNLAIANREISRLNNIMENEYATNAFAVRKYNEICEIVGME